ncbi:hypothetical protein Dsin_029282, partial [Dipteronia sinensis]
EFNCEDELEQLRASVDFLVKLCETVSSVRAEMKLLSVDCFSSGASESYHIYNDSQFCIHHLIRKLP